MLLKLINYAFTKLNYKYDNISLVLVSLVKYVNTSFKSHWCTNKIKLNKHKTTIALTV